MEVSYLKVEEDAQTDADSFTGSWRWLAEDAQLMTAISAASDSHRREARSGTGMKADTGRTTGALRQYAAACSASLMVMTTGCWLGWPSPANKRLLNNETSLHITHEDLSWMVALMDAGSAVSPVPAGFLMDIVGRKMILLGTGVVFAAAWLMALLAHTPTLLYLARFLAGMGKGVAFTVAPMYLGEIASTGIRGALSTMFAGLLWAGTLFEFTVGPLVSYDTLLILSLIVPVLFLATFVFMPETPYYLVMRRRNEEARRSLAWLRNRPALTFDDDDPDTDPVQQELKEMKKIVNENMQEQGRFSDLVSSPGNRKATVIVMLVSMFQRTCGISCLLAYSSITLPKTDSFIGIDHVIVVFGLILTLSNFLATPLVDRLGRKPLLVFSGAGCGVVTAVSAVFYYHYEQEGDNTGYLWLPYVCVCVFGLTHSVGIGVLPHTLLAELFPQNVKRYAAAASSITLALSSFAINKVYLTVHHNVGVYVMFIFFALNGLACALFSYFAVFETKGKTFAEIQRILHAHNN